MRWKRHPARQFPPNSKDSPVASKTWFITGTSRGFGREWAIAALDRGDRVAATARSTDSLSDLVQQYGDALLPLQLDVTDRDAVFAAVAQAVEHFGNLDIVVNNAGYGHFGTIEELTEAEARAQFDTNVFGVLCVTQAALPYLREQGSGHIIQVSSIGGISAFPNVGIYNGSKWAVEGFTQALAAEVEDFGIHVTLVEPAGYSTDWSGDSAKHSEQLSAYNPLREKAATLRATRQSAQGDPVATRAAILKVVDAAEPPLRIFFGDTPINVAKADYASRIETWEQWQPVSVEAQGTATDA
ncbi:MAG: oxidoreductase, short-chain dehydrogenase-reductase [Glaciihabitans sp.]|nr:oxidoreductase, short-chain dehydrogenase-reductase [Glaciihabitans sp.]